MSKQIIDVLKGFSLRSFIKKERAVLPLCNERDPPAGPSTEQRLTETVPSCLSFLSLNELSKWTEEITKSTASVYDKAMDRLYLQDRIGGGNHRMFDGGHDLAGAWEAAKNATPDDTFQQEVMGYASALWKDVTTTKGLPFMTWTKENYDKCAEWVANNVPGMSKESFYDFMSYDAIEVVNASLAAACIMFFLPQTDKRRLGEMVGSMGAVSVASANPLMGVALVLCVAYSYFVKKQEVDPKHAAVGAGLAGISAAIFAALTLPVLIELGIAITVSMLLRRHVFNNEELVQFIKLKAASMSMPSVFIDRHAGLRGEG